MPFWFAVIAKSIFVWALCFSFLRPNDIFGLSFFFQKKIDNYFVYIDDITVYGKIEIEKYNKNLRTLFEKLKQMGLKLQPDKCKYLRPKHEYLGQVISEHSIKSNPNRIEKSYKLFNTKS